jgi:hypothetical protein
MIQKTAFEQIEYNELNKRFRFVTIRRRPYTQAYILRARVAPSIMGLGGSMICLLTRQIPERFLSPFVNQKYRQLYGETEPGGSNRYWHTHGGSKGNASNRQTLQVERVPDALRDVEEGHARGKVTSISISPLRGLEFLTVTSLFLPCRQRR